MGWRQFRVIITLASFCTALLPVSPALCKHPSVATPKSNELLRKTIAMSRILIETKDFSLSWENELVETLLLFSNYHIPRSCVHIFCKILDRSPWSRRWLNSLDTAQPG